MNEQLGKGYLIVRSDADWAERMILFFCEDIKDAQSKKLELEKAAELLNMVVKIVIENVKTFKYIKNPDKL